MDSLALAQIRKINKTSDLTPQEIVAELDKYIIGQTEAKRAVAIALRNRTRRKFLPDDLQVVLSDDPQGGTAAYNLRSGKSIE